MLESKNHLTREDEPEASRYCSSSLVGVESNFSLSLASWIARSRSARFCSAIDFQDADIVPLVVVRRSSTSISYGKHGSTLHAIYNSQTSSALTPEADK